jgi:CheY-like chemotaxis protein
MAARQKILIVDDEPEILEIYQEILSRLPSGPEIHTSDTGARALALLESSIFQVILLDLRMSQMDGFQVLSIVRRKFPAVRVVVVTGAEDEQYRARAYSMGVDLYLEKPKTGKEIIHFVECIEALLERERVGGFRGIQSKSLAGILQLECITHSSGVLKVSAAGAEGRIWLYHGEITDAATGDLTGREAIIEMLGWKSGYFEVLPADDTRPRTLFEPYEQLLLETAQIREASTGAAPSPGEESELGMLAHFKGVQFAASVAHADPGKFEQWAVENPAATAAWIHGTVAALQALGEKLEAGQLQQIEALGPQRHVAILSGDSESLAVGFTRAAVLPHVRGIMKQIESKWLS